MRVFSNEAVLKELGGISKGFVKYADNITQMKFYLGKFLDESAQVNKEDAEALKTLIDQNKNLVNQVNESRKQDKAFNSALMEVERREDFHFRSEGIMQQESQRLSKKHNLSMTELWESINNEVGNFSSTLKEDLKTGLLEGVGGPLGTITRRFLLPSLQVAKESPFGKAVGDKLGKLGDNIKGLFAKSAEEAKIVDEALSGIESGVTSEDLDKAIKEINVPSQSDVKRKVVSEFCCTS